jgi:hypothetical protein
MRTALAGRPARALESRIAGGDGRNTEMSRRWTAPVLAVAALWPAMAAAQLPLSVQLPTIHVFTVQTTVSVPDSGGAYLGGIRRRRGGSSGRGLPGPVVRRPIGIDFGVAGLSVSTTVIDLDELDAAVLAQARSNGAGGRPEDASPARAGSDRQAGPTVDRLSVAEIRRRRRAETEANAAEGQDYLAQAQAAEDDGRIGLARACYQLAARRLMGEPRQQALRRLAELGGSPQARRIAAEASETR